MYECVAFKWLFLTVSEQTKIDDYYEKMKVQLKIYGGLNTF